MPGEGFNLNAEGNYECYIGDTKYVIVQGEKIETVVGAVQDFVNGSKRFHILGPLTELNFGIKTELIHGDLKKAVVGGVLEVTVGAKRELDISLKTEIGKTWKYHINVPGQKRVISDDELKAAKERQLIEDYKRQMGKQYHKTLKRLAKFAQLEEKIASQKRKASKMEANATTMRLGIDHVNLACSSFSIKVSGALKFDVGEFRVESSGECELEGSSVELKAGGDTFKVAGGLTAKGTSLMA
jgi:hypothetical protein